MRNRPYKVRFKHSNGRGWIDGFTRAATAQAEAERVNRSTSRTGMTAEYLGKEGLAERRYQDAVTGADPRATRELIDGLKRS